MSPLAPASLRLAALAALLLAFTPRLARSADAAPSEGTPVTLPEKAVKEAPLRVWIDERGVAFDRARLRESLARELTREVVLETDAGLASVRIQLEGARRARVSYTTPSGEDLTRAVELPPDRERSMQVLTWLTVNLVRDEASELLDELRRRRKEQGEAPAAEEVPAAPPPAADATAAPVAEAVRIPPRGAQRAGKPARPVGVRGAGLLREPAKRFDLALATPIALLPDSRRRELWLELAAGYADVGGLRGAGVSLGGLWVREDVRGAALALGLVKVGGSVRGAALALGYSEVTGPLVGAQAALGVTVVRAPSQGVLLAGGANFSPDFKGLELAAGLNVARDLKGVAVAPLNVQRKVQGLQLGLVNVAREVDGAALGMLSVAGNGRVQPVLWGDTDASLHLALKSIAGYAFTQFGGGISANGDEFTIDGGAGAHIPLGRFFFEPGVHYSNSQRVGGAGGAALHHDLHYLLQLGLRLNDQVDLLLAGGLQHGVAGSSQGQLGPLLRAGLAYF